MKTTYGSMEPEDLEAVEQDLEMIAPPPTPEALEKLREEKLKEADAEYERLQQAEADAKQREIDKRNERLRLANVRRSLDAKVRQKRELLDQFMAYYQGMMDIAREDMSLHNEIAVMVADLTAARYELPGMWDYMLDNGPMTHDLEVYMERQLGRVIKKYKQGAQLTVDSVMLP
jgi:multidrug efflux pump subunit AcrA (membrane-fusion protein)